MRYVIDVHTHIVPPHIPSCKNMEARWPRVRLEDDERASVLIADRVFRRIDSRSWDIQRRLRDMEASGVDLQVLSPMPELLSHWFPPAPGEEIAEALNETIRMMVAARPDKFAGVGAICMQDPVRGVRQLEWLKAAGFCGFEIGSHICGTPLGSKNLWPIYEAAEALGLTVFVHPLHPCGTERIGASAEFAAIAAFPLETALSAVSLMANGVMAQFPGLKVLLSHGGGALPWISSRLERGFELSATVRAALRDETPRTLAGRFWYDSILYSSESLKFLSNAVGESQLVVGSDYPFAIMEARPGVPVVEAFGADAACLERNAVRLFGLKARAC